MPFINLRNVTISFGLHPLLDNANFQVDDLERICVLGRNGAGKSTLLKLLQGEIKPDEGDIIRQPGVITAKLEQDVPETIKGSVYEVVAEGLGDKGKLLARYQQLTHELANSTDESLFDKLQEVQQQLDKYHAWNLSHRIDDVITRLGLNPENEFAALSGGLKRRVLLGQAIVTEPQVLLLDEPTNHLDIESIDWLENFIKEFSGTVIFITHDRRFLQNLATRMIELDRGKLQSYPGNYTEYVARKEHELEVESVHQQNFDKKLAQEEVWIRQGIKARRTRNEGRVRALKKLREVRKQRCEVIGKANLQIQQAENSGKIVITVEEISHHYQSRKLINNFSTTILRGDKIGIIGPNGIGKSTLLKILLGELHPDFGEVKQGTKLEIAYSDQLRGQLDEEKSIAENVSYGDQYIQFNGRSVHIMSYLQDFLFSPERARQPVKSLSGGERNRLLLARLFSKPANMLVLDEPTNDLDIETLELLEELLMNYEGTVLLVSHDRSFLNNVVTSTFVFEGEGKIGEYAGGFDDWLLQRPTTNQTVAISAIPMNQEFSAKVSSVPISIAAKPTIAYDVKKQKQIQVLEQKIEKLETSQTAFHLELADQKIYESGQEQKLATLQKKLKQVDEELSLLWKQWEQLMA